MSILHDSESVGQYKVQGLIKSNLYTETYRVEDMDGTPYFMKLFVLKRLPRQLLNTETNIVKEIEFSQRLKHKNVVSFIASGSIEREESNCQYYLTSYLKGSLVAELIEDGKTVSEDVAIGIFKGILAGLKYMHNQTPALCHNDLDPSNILVDDQAQNPEIIDLGHLSERSSGMVWFDTSDLNPLYHANETMVGIFDEQSDLFSACAILYAMLTGHAPWEMEIPADGDYKSRFSDLSHYRKRNPLDFSQLKVSENVKRVLAAGLQLKSQERIGSADELIKLMESECPSPDQSQCKAEQSHESNQGQQSPNYVEFQIRKGTGKGFEDIAGMSELKETLNRQVIFVIKNEEIAKEYKLTPPNGMLLYGPPGCGKSFFAEKFAEETGFSYVFVKSSDLASSFVHGSQEKINQLFEQAAKQAPVVICFDEFDALVPDRSWNNVSSEEVNEFLTQMNNCSKRGIFIVATSNRPDKIDPAVLRTGRIDKTIYVPLPDFNARKELFAIYLKGRPSEGDIDTVELARMTEGYIASDIAFIVNDSAMVAAYTRTKITEELLRHSIHNTHPSVRSDSLKQYDEIKRKMEDQNRRNVTERSVVNPW